MSEHQDPSEQYRVDKAVEPEDQEPDAEPAEHSDMETGGEMTAIATDEPVKHEG